MDTTGMTSPKIDILSQGSDLAQLLLHTVPVRGEEARLLESMPKHGAAAIAADEWLNDNTAWVAANPAAWQRVDFNWEF